ncbi:MAG: hypothetical protein V1739_06740 [Candidatus Omnitrophota bacterium]
MREQFNAIIDELVDGGSNFAASLGINRVAGQLYVLLFLSEKPMSLDEMMEKLRVSKGYVSTNIRALERWQAVRKVWVKGTRKDFYEANTDTINVVVNQLEHGLRQRFEELNLVIKRAKGKIGHLKSTQSKGQIINLEDKIKKVENMCIKTNSLLGKLDFLKLLK